MSDPIDGADVPVASVDDVVAVWDDCIQEVATAPVRDAIQAGQAAMMIAYQEAASYAAAQSDPLRATGEYLDEIGGEERGIFRVKGELDLSYSARVNATPSVADPADVISAINAILAQYTTILARYLERSDCMFLGGGLAPSTGIHFVPDSALGLTSQSAACPTGAVGCVMADIPSGAPATSWSTHLYAADGPNAPPNYPDRRYDTILNRRPGGARLFDDPFGRYFEIRVPDLAAIDATVSGLFAGDSPDDGFFLSGPVPGGPGPFTDAQLSGSFLWSFDATSLDIYEAIVNAVESIRGHSIRWLLLVDPKLTL
jgi:hypothetical protein